LAPKSADDNAGWFVESGRGNSAEPDRVLLIIDGITSSAHLSEVGAQRARLLPAITRFAPVESA
jgi:hypothetical protein